MNLRPLICGEWDGCAVWMQWGDATQSQGQVRSGTQSRNEDWGTIYEVQFALREPGNLEWGEWMGFEPEGPRSRCWCVIPTWREGWEIKGRVRNAGGGWPILLEQNGGTGMRIEGGWENAVEVVFSRARCRFGFESREGEQFFPAGTEFFSQVDGAGCGYRIGEDVLVPKGGRVEAWADAMECSGYAQLDHPGHFEIRPMLGVRIWNVAASVADVTETGREWTMVRGKKPEGFRLVVEAPRRY